MVNTRPKTESSIYSAARHWADAGLCLIPVFADGSKMPDWSATPEYFDEVEQRNKRGWKPYQARLSTPDEHQHWFGNGTAHGIGIVHGKISGNSEVLDFDEVGLFEQFDALGHEQGYGDILDTMPLIETPSGGRHLGYRCEEPVTGNQKLAQRLMEAAEEVKGARQIGGAWYTVETRIETRGEGGYTLAPGSPAACHPNQKPYRFLRGRPATLPVISGEDRNALLALAATFNEYVEPSSIVDAPHKKQSKAESETSREGLRPGDDYNARGDYEGLLEQRGWRRKYSGGDKGFWQRPGKTGRGLSATSNYAGSGLFYVFSSNASPFAPEKAYSPFAVYALLEHAGDFREAAKKLGEDGYGEALTAGVKSRTPGWSREGGEAVPSPPEAWEPPTLFTSHALPPFPLEALPDALAGFVSEVAASTQVPADMPAMIALSVIAAAGARRFVVQVGETHTEPLNLYLAVVMEPGSRKSATMDALKKPLEDAQREMALASQSDIAARAEIRGVEDKRLGFLRDQAAKAKDPAERETLTQELTEQATSLTEVPAPARLLADDVTPEKLASLMAEQSGTMALLSAEGGIFGILAGRYSDGSANLDLFLKGHAGESVRVDRQGRPSVHIDRACLTMGLTVQPDVLASLADTPSFRGRGLLGRFLYSLPEDLVGTRLYQNRAADPAARRRYEAVVHALLALPPASLEDPAARYPLLLSGAALNLWAEFANDAERRQAHEGDMAGIRDWASKLAGEAARIAGGLHLARHAHHPQPHTLPLSEETVAAAWAIGEYLIPHALAAFGQMGVSPDMALARRILKWTDRRALTEFSLRDCHQAHRSASSPSDLLPALTLLTGRGYLRLKAPAAKQGAGQPKSPVYEVNPLTQNTQNTQN